MSENKKKAILVVSFGTSFHDTRKKTIDKIVEDIKNAYPNYTVYQAWTSKMIIYKLLMRDGIQINTVSEAAAQMIADGIEELIVQPTHIINGIENELMKEDILNYQKQFNKINFGDPLLTTTHDNIQAIQAVMKEYMDLQRDEVLVFMGHGTTHYANSVYAALDYTFKDMGYDNVFLGTMESYPSIDTLKKLIHAYETTKVKLVPFMLVAGNHATNDMSGDNEYSWKNQFEKGGYKVDCIMRGLGEYEGIRQIYLEHLNNALGD